MSDQLILDLEMNKLSTLHSMFGQMEQNLLREKSTDPESALKSIESYSEELLRYQQEMKSLIEDDRTVDRMFDGLETAAESVSNEPSDDVSNLNTLTPDFKEKESLSQIKYISMLKNKLDAECANYIKLKIQKISDQELENLSEEVRELKEECQKEEELLLRTKHGILQRINQL